MRLLTLLACLPVAAMAQDFTPLAGPDIEAALNDVTLDYAGGEEQTFYASGRTLYDNGRPSWGYWTVRGDAYCSEWPPAGGWDCYTMDRAGDVLRFISETGHVTAGRIRD
ncbi:MAG: hypothetical protein AAF714_10215 [Pseudomonadota bacterium]